MSAPALQLPRNVGISISESPDMRFFSFTEGHLKDAMAGFAIYLLSVRRDLGLLEEALQGFARLILVALGEAA